MRKIFMPIVALTLVVAFLGCAIVPMKSKLEKTVSLTNMNREAVREFDVKQRSIWLLWGLFPLTVPKIDDVVEPRVFDHTGVQNLKVEPKINAVDSILTLITLGIITSRTISISGEVYD